MDELPKYQTAHQTGEKVNWKLLLKRVLPVTFVDFYYGWMLWVYLTWIPRSSPASTTSPWPSSPVHHADADRRCRGGHGGRIGVESLMRRTGNLRFARRSVLVVGLLGSFLWILPTLFLKDLTLVTICLAAPFFFLELCYPVLWAMPMDISPRHAGTAGDLMNTGFGVAGIPSPVTFGFPLDQTGSWVVPFAVSAEPLFIGAALATRLNPRPIDVAPEALDHAV